MMTSRSKSIAILLCTLVLGMTMGALLFGAVQRHRLQTAMRLVRPQHMIASIEQVVRPADEEQRQAIREVVENVVEEMGQMHLEVWTQMQSQMDSLEERLEPLLTEQQQERLSAHLDAPRRLAGRPWRGGGMRPGGMKPGFPPKGVGPPHGWWQAEGAIAQLGLSAEQKSELQALQEKHRLEMQGVRASGERPATKEMQALRTRHQSEAVQILTPEQQAKLEALMAGRPGWGDNAGRQARRRGRPPVRADTDADSEKQTDR